MRARALVLSALVAAATFTPRADADAPEGRYTKSTDAMGRALVTDGATGLTWFAALQPNVDTLEHATPKCPAPYRVPTIKELATLVDEARPAPPLFDPAYFPADSASAGRLWSTTTILDNTYTVFVLMADGTTAELFVNGTSGGADVRCVTP